MLPSARYSQKKPLSLSACFFDIKADFLKHPAWVFEVLIFKSPSKNNASGSSVREQSIFANDFERFFASLSNVTHFKNLLKFWCPVIFAISSSDKSLSKNFRLKLLEVSKYISKSSSDVSCFFSEAFWISFSFIILLLYLLFADSSTIITYYRY